ncbi:prophage tail fiber N-terminal domain-containing protein [Salmonella enterica]|nr:prophage tail fiber N-terminal domain-containing protein [Salmonella enterica]EKS4862801.1 prophage tail fiber N-terminal domain-containing protein [Salmonella enterica]EKS4880514.1 prophage tail fiber N-terminal domain-containing protein [Salmonella enterica]EKS4884973.1 prophage tail fiber N-terminal domain-containing protein [Salmonella enterica]EKS5974629.1 prophage tail fiber N-terminal domain-containing protein [Salmonella enterica]
MAKIAGIYANGFGAPVAGIELILTARATSAGVIMTTTAAQTTGADGSYGFDVLAGVYVVTANGAYLGVITVGTDSPDGTLNDYLAGYDPSALTPEIVQTVEELVKEAQEAAAAAEGSAAAAADSATTAEKAAERAEAASTDEAVAKLDEANVFSQLNKFKAGLEALGISTFEQLRVAAWAWLKGGARIDGEVNLGQGEGGKISFHEVATFLYGKRLKFYIDKTTGGGIEFWTSGSVSADGGLLPDPYNNTLRIKHKFLKKLLIEMSQVDPDGLKFIGKDGVEQSIYHSGYLPPAASVAAELPTGGVRQPQFFFDEAAGQLYFLYEAKKYAVTLIPA